MGNGDSTLEETILSSVRWQFLLEIIGKIFGPLSFFVLSYTLLPRDFGVLAIILLLFGISQIFMEMGLGAAIIQKKDLTDADLSSAFSINFVLSLLLVGIFFVLSPNIGSFFEMPELAVYLRFFSLIFVINAFGMVHMSLNMREFNFKNITKIRLISTISYSFVIIVLSILGFGLWSVIIGQILMNMINSALLMFSSEWENSFGIEWASASELVHFGGGVFLTRFIGSISNLDTLIIGKILGASSLGLYSFSYNVSSMLPQTIVNTTSTILFPGLSSVQENLEKVRSLYLDATKYLAVIGVPVVVGFVFTISDFTHLFLAERWVESIFIMQLLSLFFLTNVLGGGLWGNTLYSLGHSYKTLNLSIIRLCTLGLFVYAGAVLGGLIGAVVGMILYGLILRIVFQYIVNYYVKMSMMDYFRAIFPALLCGTIMAFGIVVFNLTGIFEQIIPLHFVMVIFIGALLYSVFLRFIYPGIFAYIFQFFRSTVKRSQKINRF